jgi:hypothetical protein
MHLKHNKRKGFTRRKKDVEVPNMEGNYYWNKRKNQQGNTSNVSFQTPTNTLAIVNLNFSTLFSSSQ